MRVALTGLLVYIVVTSGLEVRIEEVLLVGKSGPYVCSHHVKREFSSLGSFSGHIQDFHLSSGRIVY